MFDNGFNLTVELDESEDSDKLLRNIKKNSNSELNLGLFGRSSEEMVDDSRNFNVNEMIFGPSNVWNVPKPLSLIHISEPTRPY